MHLWSPNLWQRRQEYTIVASFHPQRHQTHFLPWEDFSPLNSFQFSHSIVSESLQPHEPQHARNPCPSTNHSLPKLMSIESMMPSNYLILCHPLLLLPSVFPSIRVFSSESALHVRWPKYWSFSFSISLPNEYSLLISLRIDWLDLLAVQGRLVSWF